MILLSTYSNGKSIDVLNNKYKFDKIIVFTGKKYIEDVKKYSEFQIIDPFDVQEISLSMINTIKSISEDIMINITEGTNVMAAGALTASYYTGIKTVYVSKEDIVTLPVPSSGYDGYLTKKTKILLKKINELAGTSEVIQSNLTTGNAQTLTFPLRKLEKAKLVERREDKGKKYVKLSTAGKLFVEMNK